MPKPFTKKDIEVLEQRGLWKASSYLHKRIKVLIRKNLPLRMGDIKTAHKIIFETAKQKTIAGKYRKSNCPELKRINGTMLKISDYRQISSEMAHLDWELQRQTKNLKSPKTEKDYNDVISLAAKFSHWLACIHPFENGNGRASRLLLDAILLRARLSGIAIKKSKQKYLRAMRQADDNDFSLLGSLILNGIADSKQRIYAEQEKKAELMGAKKQKKTKREGKKRRKSIKRHKRRKK